MLEAIQMTALETQERVKMILKTMEKVKELVQTKASKIYSKDLIETIFKHPYCKVSFLEQAGVAKRQTASMYLHTLEQLEILQSLKVGREVYYINTELAKILSK